MSLFEIYKFCQEVLIKALYRYLFNILENYEETLLKIIIINLK